MSAKEEKNTTHRGGANRIGILSFFSLQKKLFWLNLACFFVLSLYLLLQESVQCSLYAHKNPPCPPLQTPGGGASVLDANYPPQLTVGRRPLGGGVVGVLGPAESPPPPPGSKPKHPKKPIHVQCSFSKEEFIEQPSHGQAFMASQKGHQHKVVGL